MASNLLHTTTDGNSSIEFLSATLADTDDSRDMRHSR